TRLVLGQFLPSILAGALLTATLVGLGPQSVALLPGIWALCFGVAVFASRVYLPRSAGWVALFYYAIGAAQLWAATGSTALHGWWVGLTFGCGQLLAALVLYWNLERDMDHPHRWTGEGLDEDIG